MFSPVTYSPATTIRHLRDILLIVGFLVGILVIAATPRLVPVIGPSVAIFILAAKAVTIGCLVWLWRLGVRPFLRA